MSDHLLQLRLYDPAKDAAMIAQWCEDHHYAGIPNAILPALGVVVQSDGDDVAALWLYMDNSCGVAFAEHPITKGGLKPKLAKAALVFAMNFLKLEARANGYHTIIIRTLPALARWAKDAGFVKDGEQTLVTMFCVLEEDNGNRG
jgi:hypothetical protein